MFLDKRKFILGFYLRAGHFLGFLNIPGIFETVLE